MAVNDELCRIAANWWTKVIQKGSKELTSLDLQRFQKILEERIKHRYDGLGVYFTSIRITIVDGITNDILKEAITSSNLPQLRLPHNIVMIIYVDCIKILPWRVIYRKH
jgi:hypothetical protein